MSLMEAFSTIADFRRAQGKRYLLSHILMMCVMGIMSGFFGFRELGEFAKSNKEELIAYLGLKRHRVPSHVTIRAILMGVDFKQLSAAFYEWAKQHVPLKSGEWICGDGKSLCSTVTDQDNDKQDFINLVSLYSQKQGLVVNAKRIHNGKESEIPAMRELIRMLEVKDTVISLDALHCQTETVNTVIESGNHYLIKVKGNQPKLHQSLQKLTEQPQPLATHTTEERQRGRDEIRRVSVYETPAELQDKWTGLQRGIHVERTRCLNGITATTHSYYISSLKCDEAKVFQIGIRGHWLIENQLHYVKDVIQNEDECGIAHKNSASVLSVLKNFSINILRKNGFKSIKKAKIHVANKIPTLYQMLQIRT